MRLVMSWREPSTDTPVKPVVVDEAETRKKKERDIEGFKLHKFKLQILKKKKNKKISYNLLSNQLIVSFLAVVSCVYNFYILLDLTLDAYPFITQTTEKLWYHKQ